MTLRSAFRKDEIMKPVLSESPRMDKTTLSVASLDDASDEKAYWLSCTPHERLRQMETLRRINYGHRATDRLQRVLEIVESP